MDESNESPISGAELPDGCYILFFNDVVHSFVEPKALARLSKGCMEIERLFAELQSYAPPEGAQKLSVLDAAAGQFRATAAFVRVSP